jgi:hypothetical protein
MITEWQKKYTEWYLRTIHYRYQWARWLSRKEIEKKCKEKWYNKDTLDVILHLNRWDLIDNDPLRKKK